VLWWLLGSGARRFLGRSPPPRSWQRRAHELDSGSLEQ
jgi:hypothetical protein